MSQEHNDQKSGAESMDATLTPLPKNTGIEGSPMLGFSTPDGVWVDGQPLLRRDGRAVPLGTRFVAVLTKMQFGFKRHRGGQRAGQYVTAATRELAQASPLYHDPAWSPTLFLPLADPATGTLAFTFFAPTPQRCELIDQLLAATLQQAELGVHALPIVELAREKYRFSDIRAEITPEMSAQAAAICDTPWKDDMPDPPFDDMDLFDPALPIVAWQSLQTEKEERS